MPQHLPFTFGVIVPVHNEPRLRRVLARFDSAIAPHVVVVDDGSTDGCTAAAAEYPVTVLKHATRRGVGAAIRNGLLHLKANGVDVAVVMAGNNKDNPQEIPLLLSAIQGVDYVQGSRYLDRQNAKLTPFSRRLLTRAAALVWTMRFWTRMTDVTNGFRAYRLKLLGDSRVNICQEWLDRYELEYYLHYKAHSLGYRCVEVPVSKCYPVDGLPVSKIQLSRDWWSLCRPLVLLTAGLRD
jgi:dolichol-phosphate mannosyltransferase